MFNCDAGHELMLQENDSVCVAKECGTFLTLSLSLEHGSVEPAKMLFGDVGLVTCLPGFTLSGGVKCGADADFVPGGSLPVCSPRSCGVPPEVSGASRSAEEVLFQGNVTYTCDRGYVVGGSFSQADVVCLPRPCGGPPLAQSASRSDVAVVYGQSVTLLRHKSERRAIDNFSVVVQGGWCRAQCA